MKDHTAVPAPVVFTSSPPCKVCANKLLREWLHESLKLTHKGGHPKPSIQGMTRNTKAAFGDKVIARSGLHTHLERHEPLWGAWDGEASS